MWENLLKMNGKILDQVSYITVHQPHLKRFLQDFPNARWTSTSSGNTGSPLFYGYYVNVSDILQHRNHEKIISSLVFEDN